MRPFIHVQNTCYIAWFLFVYFLLRANLAFGTATEPSDLLFVDAKDYVMAPTRLNQIRSEAPAPVTVITADDIKALGFRRIEDVLRVVPGMVVGERSGSDIRVNFHGGQAFYGKRLQILIDGISFFQPDFSVMDWGKFPIALNDIARIEVVRSSNAATFGSNALAGVVNIITKSPAISDPAASVKTFTKADRQNGLYGRLVNQSETVGVSLSGERFTDDGFDVDETGTPRRDDQQINRLFGSADITLTELDISMKAGLTEGRTAVQHIQQSQASFPDIEQQDQFYNLKIGYSGWDSHQVSLQGGAIFLERQQTWVSCVPTLFFSSELGAIYRSSPALANALIRRQPLPPLTPEQVPLVGALQAKLAQLQDSAFQPTCGDVNQNYTERALSIELQDIYHYSEHWRHVAAIGTKQDRGISETFMNGSRYNTTRYGLFNLEYTGPWLSSNVGTFIEEDDISPIAVSSRGSLNLKLSPQATLRMAVARSERTPDTWEQTVDWSYTVRNLNPLYEGESTRLFYQSARAPGNLRSEVFTERDLGVYITWPNISLTLDVNYFQNTLKYLISEKIEFVNFNPTNEGSAKQSGVDIELGAKITPTVNIGGGYSYQDTSASNPYEESLNPRHSGFAYTTWHFPLTQTFTVAAYSSDDVGGSPYLRTDAIYSKNWQIAKSSLDTSLAIHHYHYRAQRYFIDSGVYEDNLREDASEFELALDLAI